jgi:uncharacterized phage infection (PIP) family protein YhgE
MRRALLALSAAVWLLLAGVPARAEFHSLDLTAFRDQLQTMHDAYVAPLSKAQAKEKALLAKALKEIDKAPKSMYDDLLRLAKLVKASNKVDDLPEEIRAQLRAAADYAIEFIEGYMDELQERIDLLADAKARNKAQKKLNAARNALARATALPSLASTAAALADVRAACHSIHVFLRKAEDSE